jgi:hypothetical protein
MRLVDRLKARYLHQIERKYVRVIKRTQFNVTIADELAEAVKFMATIYKVPRYVIAEHLLQVGSYHVLLAMKDLEKRQKLVDHLVKVHLLGDKLKDDEKILRLED